QGARDEPEQSLPARRRDAEGTPASCLRVVSARAQGDHGTPARFYTAHQGADVPPRHGEAFADHHPALAAHPRNDAGALRAARTATPTLPSTSCVTEGSRTSGSGPSAERARLRRRLRE